MSELQDFFECAGFETRSYSGRGMYGKECLAIVIEDWCDLIQSLLKATADLEDSDLVYKIADSMYNMKQDSMGRDRIVLYWPRIPYEGETPKHNWEDEEDEEWEDE